GIAEEEGRNATSPSGGHVLCRRNDEMALRRTLLIELLLDNCPQPLVEEVIDAKLELALHLASKHPVKLFSGRFRVITEDNREDALQPRSRNSRKRSEAAAPRRLASALSAFLRTHQIDELLSVIDHGSTPLKKGKWLRCTSATHA